MKLSTSTTSRRGPGPARACQARVSVSASRRSSWRTFPNVNAPRNVPSLDGRDCPRSADTRPERSMSQSSMQSVPRTIAKINVITLRPALAARLVRRGARTARQRLDPQPRRKRGDQHDPGVRHRPLIVEDHARAIQSDRPAILPRNDLLSQDPVAPNDRFLPAAQKIPLVWLRGLGFGGSRLTKWSPS
jgi:hypothetical protein